MMPAIIARNHQRSAPRTEGGRSPSISRLYLPLSAPEMMRGVMLLAEKQKALPSSSTRYRLGYSPDAMPENSPFRLSAVHMASASHLLDTTTKLHVLSTYTRTVSWEYECLRLIHCFYPAIFTTTESPVARPQVPVFSMLPLCFGELMVFFKTT